MTRINLVPVEELVDKHLVAEKHEITRVLALARNHNPRTVKIPPTYRMGTGHVTFFYNKIGFIVSRYHELCKEMRKRGFNVNELTTEEMCHHIWLEDMYLTRMRWRCHEVGLTKDWRRWVIH